MCCVPRPRGTPRAITFNEVGDPYAAHRERAAEPISNPSGFRQHVAGIPFGARRPTRTIAMDKAVQVIAGIRTNRMSGLGCLAINPGPANPDACDAETVLVSASVSNVLVN